MSTSILQNLVLVTIHFECPFIDLDSLLLLELRGGGMPALQFDVVGVASHRTPHRAWLFSWVLREGPNQVPEMSWWPAVVQEPRTEVC